MNPSLDQLKNLWLGKKKFKHLPKWSGQTLYFKGPSWLGYGEGWELRPWPLESTLEGLPLFTSLALTLLLFLPLSFPSLSRHPFFRRLLSWKIPDSNDLAATLLYGLNLMGKANSGTSPFPRKFDNYQDP